MNDIRRWFAQQGLTRSTEQRILGGVCAGLGRRLGIGPWSARLLVLLALLVIPGSQILLYPILWILMPTEEAAGYQVPNAAPVQPS